jgi:cellulose biosynthesis protein BcsQ
MNKPELDTGLYPYIDFSTLHLPPQFAADSLGISQQTLKLMEKDHDLNIARVARGTVPMRAYTPHDLFHIARIRREKGLTKGLGRPATISTFVQKGGTVKTTTSVNLGIYLALQGLKVVIIDNDPQADSTSMLGYDPDLSANELSELNVPIDRAVSGHLGNLLGVSMYPQMTLDEVIKKPFGEFGPHLIPSDESFEDLDVALRNAHGSDFRYSMQFGKAQKNKLAHFDLSSYDVIIIDNAPSSSLLTRNSMVASDFLICPIRMDRFSFKALSRLSDKLNAFAEEYERNLQVFVLPTMFIKNRPRVQANLAKLNETFPGKVSQVPLYFSEDYSKSLDNLVPVMLWKQATENSIGAMRSVFDTVLTRIRATVRSA